MDDRPRAQKDINIAIEILNTNSTPSKSPEERDALLEDVAVHLAFRRYPELHETHNDRANSSHGRVQERATKRQGADQERHEERERHQGVGSIYRFRDEQFIEECSADLCADLVVNNVPVDKVDLVQYSEIKAAVHLNELGVWPFEFRVIERANDETRNVYELRLDVQYLRTILQLGLNPMGGCAKREESSREAEEKVVTVVNRCRTCGSTPMQKR